MVLQPFVNYYSNHSGLNQLFLTFKRSYLKKTSEDEEGTFFNKNHIIKKITSMENPIGGGQIILCNNQVVCWDLKSRAYSSELSCCNENNPDRSALLSSIGLPLNRFITLQAAEIFDQKLNEYFDVNGNFLIRNKAEPVELEKITESNESLANKISSFFGLAALFEPEKQELSATLTTAFFG